MTSTYDWNKRWSWWADAWTSSLTLVLMLWLHRGREASQRWWYTLWLRSFYSQGTTDPTPIPMCGGARGSCLFGGQAGTGYRGRGVHVIISHTCQYGVPSRRVWVCVYLCLYVQRRGKRERERERERKKREREREKRKSVWILIMRSHNVFS